MQQFHPSQHHPAPTKYFGFTWVRGKLDVQHVLMLPRCWSGSTSILCYIPGSLGLTEALGASWLCPLTAPAAWGSWRMMCCHLAACSAVWQGREALVLLLSVLQPFEIKYCLFSFQVQAPSKSPQFSIPHQNHKTPGDSCIKIGNKLMQCLCSYASWMRQKISNL